MEAVEIFVLLIIWMIAGGLAASCARLAYGPPGHWIAIPALMLCGPIAFVVVGLVSWIEWIMSDDE